jgi:isoamylase
MRQIWPGSPYPLGATHDGEGVNFAVYSRAATRVEVCLYADDDPGKEVDRFDLPEVTEHTWHGYAPGLRPGTLYGLRVDGPYAPERGLRCNRNKLLVDPYARALSGEVDWKQPIFAYKLGDELEDRSFDARDSAAGVPKCVVVDERFDWGGDAPPKTAWRHTVLYELHVRGFTKLHPEVPEELRGTYAGLGHPAAVGYLKNLGVTAVELLPVHEFVDDGYLLERGLKNYWGYSSLAYFAPAQRYAKARTAGGQVAEFKAMVKALHAAGIEVILDVVYNHTCEGNHLGPTLSFKGIDNASYYWLMPEARYFLDFTGTGNSINASSPVAARLIVDSLRYWVGEMHVDGFRFDLASTIGRVGRGQFDRHAPIFQILHQDPVLSRVKLVAEPWDTGLGGYQVGNFPAPFREWNGKFRDAIRRYWKGDANLASEIGYRLSGSADLFQGERRQPQASVNFITSHDGFTLHDLVSYDSKHNEANGENNRDGADDNSSWNHGAEGETDDAGIIELRERQKRNLLASLLVSQGVPMILGGDEMGRTQRGNNNAYCQDSEISWFDWRLNDTRRALVDFTRQLIQVRRRHPVLQRRRFLQGGHIWDSQSKDVTWLRPDGDEMEREDWQKPWISSLGLMLGGDTISTLDERGERLIDDGLLVLMNSHHEALTFKLPDDGGPTWLLEFDTARGDKAEDTPFSGEYEVAARSMVVMRQPLDAEAAKLAGTAAARARRSEAARRRRRAGLVVPLFSIRSGKGWGLGEIADIPRFAAWARSAGFSLLQFLPVQQVSGADASPYAAVSAFAIDPVYLSLEECEDFVAAGGRAALPPELQSRIAAAEGAPAVDWAAVRAVKREGIAVAFARFLRDEWEKQTPRARQLAVFMKQNREWIDDYSLYTVWHEKFQKSWVDWPPGPRDRDPGTIDAFRRDEAEALLRVRWVAWQLDLQWRKARREASDAGVELMGDLPFTVGQDSADVWANRAIFRIDWHVGTPPDESSPEGTDWGLPVYDWGALQSSDFGWIRARCMRAGVLFGLYRVDHAIGFYRTYYRSVDGHASGFTPGDEESQVGLGESLMGIMRHFGEVVAEDLGAVPPFLRPSLERLGVAGYRVLRWEKDGAEFRPPSTWPVASVATNSTHDTDTTADWYDALSEGDREALRKIPGLEAIDPKGKFDDAVRDGLLRTIYDAPSALVLVLFQDAVGSRDRIQKPGTVDKSNWTYRLGASIDALEADQATTARLAKLAADTHRSG